MLKSDQEIAEDVRHVVVLKWNRLYGEMLREQLSVTWPKAKMHVFQLGLEALTCIQKNATDLFITGAWVEDMDGLEHLEPFVENNLPIMIVTSLRDARTYCLLREVRFDGLYDGLAEGVGNFAEALHHVMRHQLYVSATMMPFLKRPKNITLDSLTEKEQLVLSVIGDGCDDMEASKRLGISPGTVNTHRKSIMGKRGLHHRGQLMCYAIQEGYVHVTPKGVFRPGFQRRIRDITQMKAGDAG